MAEDADVDEFAICKTDEGRSNKNPTKSILKYFYLARGKHPTIKQLDPRRTAALRLIV
jgi:hypothetical protein